MTPAHSSKSTRSSHSAQYCRYQTYSVALKNSLPPELFHIGIVCLLLLPIPRPQRCLGHSLFSKNHSQKSFLFFSSKFQNSHSLSLRSKLSEPVYKKKEKKNKLFKIVIQKGSFPPKSNISLLSLIHKNGSKSNHSNYRKMPITCDMGLLFNKVIFTRLLEYVE